MLRPIVGRGRPMFAGAGWHIMGILYRDTVARIATHGNPVPIASQGPSRVTVGAGTSWASYVATRWAWYSANQRESQEEMLSIWPKVSIGPKVRYVVRDANGIESIPVFTITLNVSEKSLILFNIATVQPSLFSFIDIFRTKPLTKFRVRFGMMFWINAFETGGREVRAMVVSSRTCP